MLSSTSIQPRRLIVVQPTRICGLVFALLLAAGFSALKLPNLSAQVKSSSVVKPYQKETPTGIKQFLSQHCLDCHTGSGAEAGFDMSKIHTHVDERNDDRWVRVYERVSAGEMPPPEFDQPSPKQAEEFLGNTKRWIQSFQSQTNAKLGRVRSRRLTNLQLERTLQDLLAIDLPLADELPDESRNSGFTGIAASQSISHFQLEQHLAVVDLALEAAFERGLSRDQNLVDGWSRFFDAESLARRNPRRRTREPEIINDLAVTWSARLAFYGRLPATEAPRSGWYRFKVKAKSLNPPRGSNTVWCTVRSGPCVSTAPMLNWVGAFEAESKLKEFTFEAWMPEGYMLEIRPGDNTLRTGNFAGGQVGTGEGGPQNLPGVAIESIEVTRFFKNPQDRVRWALFGPLDIQPISMNPSERGLQKKRSDLPTVARVVSKRPRADLKQRVTQFASRAFRRPIDNEVAQPYIDVALESYRLSSDFSDSLRKAYRAILCSPRFLYFIEQPGELDDYEVANRLSYFLWNRMPDAKLMTLASQKRLRDKKVLSQQVDRLLNHPYGKNFVVDLADQWLDLHMINSTSPDRRMFRTFDPIVQNAMLAETYLFLDSMVRKNESVTQLIDADYTFLNSRLANYYNIPLPKKTSNETGIPFSRYGDQMRPVPLSPKEPRGGLITQGAILKVTANGSNTSPVVRGVWMAEKILGEHVPPPPANIPAIEPDVRGAKTIRDLLKKHQSDASCAVCHRKIDPPGFALENFDPTGRFRTKYVARKGKQTFAQNIDPSGTLPNGESFSGIESFKRLVTKHPKRLAYNTAEKLLTFATGASVQFADRSVVADCVERTKASDYGMRSLIKSVVTSQTFLNK